MRRTKRIRFCMELSALTALLATCLAGALPASAQWARVSRTSAATTTGFTTTAGYLSAVAATSPTNAWAVGGTPNDSLLILHWNGSNWARARTPGCMASRS